MAEDIPAENIPDHISTVLMIRDNEPSSRRLLIIPKDVTPLEAAGLAVFLTEFAQRHIMKSWRLDDRLDHFGLKRFLKVYKP